MSVVQVWCLECFEAKWLPAPRRAIQFGAGVVRMWRAERELCTRCGRHGLIAVEFAPPK